MIRPQNGNSPGFSQLDLQLIRMLRRTERFFVSLRAEAFNLFNHAILANPDAVLPDALCWITSLAAPVLPTLQLASDC